LYFKNVSGEVNVEEGIAIIEEERGNEANNVRKFSFTLKLNYMLSLSLSCLLFIAFYVGTLQYSIPLLFFSHILP